MPWVAEESMRCLWGTSKHLRCFEGSSAICLMLCSSQKQEDC